MFKRYSVKRFALLVAGVSVFIVGAGLGSWRLCEAQGGSDYESIELFTDVLSMVKKSYVEEVDTKKLIYGAINGMLASLDPHSSFMPPEMFKEMKIETKGAFGGLGIEITVKDGMLMVISPIEDTPAYRAGIKAGDHILKIDDKYTKDMTTMDAVNRMRGPKGTKVILTIMRDGFEKPKEFPMVRDIIQVKSVKYKTLDDGYGYIRIAQFQEKTDEDLVKALKSLRDANGGNLRGLVIDLRNDPGGLLDQAVRVSEHFVEEGKLIVYTEGREKDSKMRFTSRGAAKEPHYPIVVLINGGKTIIPLSDNSGLRLTTARYYTPNGRSIQAKGITPDLTVEQKELAKQEKKDTIHIREKDLENHFESGEGKEHGEGKTDAKLPVYKADEQIRGDYQILRALDLLKGWEILKSVISAS